MYFRFLFALKWDSAPALKNCQAGKKTAGKNSGGVKNSG
jgi:hypothetical protein